MAGVCFSPSSPAEQKGEEESNNRTAGREMEYTNRQSRLHKKTVSLNISKKYHAGCRLVREFTRIRHDDLTKAKKKSQPCQSLTDQSLEQDFKDVLPSVIWKSTPSFPLSKHSQAELPPPSRAPHCVAEGGAKMVGVVFPRLTVPVALS